MRKSTTHLTKQLRCLGSAVSRRWRGGCKPISTGGLVRNNHDVSPRSTVLPAMDLRINDRALP